jgi:UDP-N-acetylmuramyl pentapeptide phosphotransferase/UDP-N-acetylglucosamine-1-phosphate transferase
MFLINMLNVSISVLSSILVRLVVMADIGSAFQSVAQLLASFLGGVLAFILVVEGYLYISAVDDTQKAMHAKRAIGAAIAGGILVAVAVNLAPELVSMFKK